MITFYESTINIGLDHRDMSEVNLKELLKTSWLSNAAPSLNKNAQRANTLAYWIASEFLSCRVKLRQKLLDHYLRICQVHNKNQNNKIKYIIFCLLDTTYK